MAKSCAICRKAVPPSVKLFKAPLNELKRQRWNESCGIILKDNSKICEKHFLRSDFINAPRDPMAAKTRLMPGAVPSVLCGNALREAEIVYRVQPEKKKEFPISSDEIKEQVICESSKMEFQRIRLDNIHSFCRTCLTSIALQTVGHGLKFNVHKTQDLAKWINECTQLKVEKNDGYPKYLCQECYHKLESFNEFRTTCSQSLHLLESLLGANNGIIKDPIELDTVKTKIDLCKTNEKDLNMKEEIAVSPNWWNLDRYDISIDLEKLDTREKEKLVEIKIENTNIHEKKIKQHTTDSMQTLKSDEELFLDATEFLETGNFSSGDVIKFRADEESSNDSLLNTMFPNKQQQIEILAKFNDETQTYQNSSIKFECEFCQRRFKNEKNLSAHLRIHQGLKPYQCSHCEQSYSTPHNMRRHIRVSHKDVKNNEVLITCPFEGCDKQFELLGALRSHYRSKHLENQKVSPEPTKLFICEVCGLNFKMAKNLKIHSFKHRPKEEYPYKCDKCDKCYVSSKNFKEHQMRHEGIKNFVCPYCGMRKTTRHELNYHINYHTKKKQWPCPLCPRVFNGSGNLKLHDRLFHKRIRNYKCSHCGQCYGKLETLKNHEMRHTGEKPHECKICGRRFIILSTLRTHMKIHGPNGEKVRKPKDDIRNFKCSYCEKSFRTMNVLQNHELIHTGEKPHKCEICGKCFRQLSALRYHLNWHKRVEGLGNTGPAIRPGTYEKKKPKRQSPDKEEELETDFATLVTDVHVD